MLMLFSATIPKAEAQDARVVTWREVEVLLNEPGDSLTILNFWATWCKPCVAELPVFEKIRKEHRKLPVRFFYISLDFKEEKSRRLDPFIRKKIPDAAVWLLDETDYNQWIGKIDAAWSGAIPATLLFQNSTKKRIFAESELSEEKLRSHIQKFLPTSKQ
jgi:thiol-disulfide isomerase/thioredoxin